MIAIIMSGLLMGQETVSSSAEINRRVQSRVEALGRSGRLPSAAEKQAVASLELCAAEAEWASESLSQCLAELKRQGDKPLTAELLRAREDLDTVFDLNPEDDASASDIRAALARFQASQTSVLSALNRSIDRVSAVRYQLQSRPNSSMKPSWSFRVLKAQAKTDSVHISVQGLPLEQGAVTRVKGDSVILIASGSDSRQQRMLEMKESQNIKITEKPLDNEFTAISFGTQDGRVTSRWKLSRLSYTWSSQASPHKAGEIKMQRFDSAKQGAIEGHFGIIHPKAAKFSLSISVKGLCEWDLSSTRNGKTVMTKESNPMSGSVQLQLYCL